MASGGYDLDKNQLKSEVWALSFHIYADLVSPK